MIDPEKPPHAKSRLIEIMQLELKILRDVLHFLKEEEEALLKNEKDLAKLIFQETKELKKQLKAVQKKRRAITKEVFQEHKENIDLHHFNSEIFHEMNLEDDFGLETLSLKEQILKIISRIDEQKLRNSKTSGEAPNVQVAIKESSQPIPSSKLQTLGPEEEKKAS